MLLLPLSLVPLLLPLPLVQEELEDMLMEEVDELRCSLCGRCVCGGGGGGCCTAAVPPLLQPPQPPPLHFAPCPSTASCASTAPVTAWPAALAREHIAAPTTPATHPTAASTHGFRRCKSHADLEKHFKQLHAREHAKRLGGPKKSVKNYVKSEKAQRLR